MGIALGGLALGVLIGPPFGGFMYEFVGKSAPFLILAFLALLDGCEYAHTVQSVRIRQVMIACRFLLYRNTYEYDCYTVLTFSSACCIKTTRRIDYLRRHYLCKYGNCNARALPANLHDGPDGRAKVAAGSCFPASLNILFDRYKHIWSAGPQNREVAGFIDWHVHHWLGLDVPFATHPNHLIIPMAALGFGIGMVDSSMMPELGFLVDIRHSSVYGGVYAIGDIAFCLGFAIGPALSGSLVEGIGFKAMLFGIGFICCLYGPLLAFLKNPPVRSEQEKQEASVNMFFN
ncbi:unnamed protein product [Sphagnum tenellum]